MTRVIAPQKIKLGLWHCLKTGTNPEFPSQGTPQGSVISPTLANIALDGVEDIHPSLLQNEWFKILTLVYSTKSMEGSQQGEKVNPISG